MSNSLKYPHESFDRLPQYSKNEDVDNYLLALNEILKNSDLKPHKLVGNKEAASLPIIYVVSAPRSGGTLLGQVLTAHLPLGYINNFAARFWLRPSVGIALSRAVLGEDSRKEITFESSFGRTSGPAGQNEFGYFWRHWLRLDESPTHHLSSAQISKIDLHGLKSVLHDEIIGSFGAPVLFKNPICGFHAEFLTKVHENSLFVYIHRDPFDVASSILKMRQTIYGKYDAWWSVKPGAYPFDLKTDNPEEEVVNQVMSCRSELKDAISNPSVKSMSVSYKQLCKDPLSVVKHVSDKITDMGFAINPVGIENLVRFSRQDASELPHEMLMNIKEHMSGFDMNPNNWTA